MDKQNRLHGLAYVQSERLCYRPLQKRERTGKECGCFSFVRYSIYANSPGLSGSLPDTDQISH